MINTTDRLVLCEVLNLDAAIRQGINAVLVHLERRYGQPPVRVKWDSALGFYYFFSSANVRSDSKFGSDFLDAAFAFSALSSRNEGLSNLFAQFDKNLCGLRPPACAIPAIKQGIKLLLVELWKQKVILLPTVFSPGPHFDPVPIGSEVYLFTKRFNPENSLEEIAKSDARRLFYYMPRVLFATSWVSVEDVSIDELADLHRAHRRFIMGQSEMRVLTSPVPWVLFLVELQKAFPERVSYSAEELVKYSQWTTGSILEQPFAGFMCAKNNADTRAERSLFPKRRKLYSRRSNEISEEDADEFIDLAKSKHHADAINYYQNLTGKKRGGFDWLTELPRYPGRDHISLESLVPYWRQVFKAFLKHRKEVKGYEDQKAVTSSLNHLADYLFLYLPWWKELYPDSIVQLPLAPKDFGRYSFFWRSADEPLERFPETFAEILKLRRGAESQYVALKHIQIFFRFVEYFYSEDKEIAGPNFKSPIFDDFDLPRVSKRTKTSKIVFPKGAYSYLIHYVYAVEAMGEYLLGRCLANEISISELRLLNQARWLETSALGFVPYVRVRGKLSPVQHVPNVFNWVTRQFRSGGEAPVERFVPHLTVLRLLIAAIETGLRLSSLRWLDRRTWDQENRGEQAIHKYSLQPSDRYIYRLFVNTDKTKEKPWVTNIVFRVRSLLLREDAFQHSIDEPDMDDAVPYKGRDESRFGHIRPLFRGTSSANPVGENFYQGYWVLLLVGFQCFYSSELGRRVLFTKVKPVSMAKSDDEPKMIVLEDGNRYCPVSILAINTPHACRATYATNRQGLIETSDMAMQLGHNDPAVTGYYQSPRAEDLCERLEVVDRAIFDDAGRFESDNPVFVRPDKPDSAMARSFMANRDVAIKRFRVMPAISLWNTADTEGMSSSAIEELRNGPMSLVRFHPTHICPVGDECPADIVKSVGDFKRCGMCPLALKGIDHLPAIAAKKNTLIERIRYQLKQREILEEAGEVEGAEELWESVELDTNEWIGWQLSEEVLARSYAEILSDGGSSDDASFYHAEEPEVVRQHLQRVVRNSSEVDFLLCRIAESNAYPTMQTPQVQAVASGIRRRLLGGRDTGSFISDLPGPADVTLTASLLKTVMRANNLSLSDVVKQLTSETVLPASSYLRIGETA